mmetsp:Transcript_4368/g.5803  ORF Transcript_4368/g.5803 Transcript_4368/m.5803 type:complete len:85 (-) Transcript_4368:254-508(-)
MSNFNKIECKWECLTLYLALRSHSTCFQIIRDIRTDFGCCTLILEGHTNFVCTLVASSPIALLFSEALLFHFRTLPPDRPFPAY